MKIGIIVAISVVGGIVLVMLSTCLTAFFGPIFGEILDELEERGGHVADKIHYWLHPEPEVVPLNEGLKRISKVMATLASAMNSKSNNENAECNGMCTSCTIKEECAEYALKERRHLYEAQHID